MAGVLGEEARRPHIEDSLQQAFPGQWRFDPAVPLGRFDLDGSLAARIGLRDLGVPREERIAQFMAEMVKGASFPPIIAIEQPDGLFIVDGLLICEAAFSAAKLHHPAYILPAGIDPVMAHIQFNSTPGGLMSEPVDLDEGQIYRVLCTPTDGDPFDFIDKYRDRDGNTLIFRAHRINLDVMENVQISAYRRGE